MPPKQESEVMMDEQLSALIDNELEAQACERTIARVTADPALREAWSRQAMLRAVLAGEDSCMPDASFADRVMAGIAEDAVSPAGTPSAKVVSFDRPSSALRWWATGGLAIAASVMSVAIVLGVMPVEKPGQAQLLATAEPASGLQEVSADASSQADMQREMEEYLLDHQRMAGRHGLAVPRGYMRMATPGFTQVSYSGE